MSSSMRKVRDIFCWLAEADLVELRWSSDVLTELRRALVDSMNKDPGQVDRLIRTLRRAFPLAEVHGYEPLILGLALRDPNDRHVLAAAIAGERDVLVTYNIRDFADADQTVVAETVDRALEEIVKSNETATAEIIRSNVARLSRPSFELADWLGLRACMSQNEDRARAELDSPQRLLPSENGRSVDHRRRREHCPAELGAEKFLS